MSGQCDRRYLFSRFRYAVNGRMARCEERQRETERSPAAEQSAAGDFCVTGGKHWGIWHIKTVFDSEIPGSQEGWKITVQYAVTDSSEGPGAAPAFSCG